MEENRMIKNKQTCIRILENEIKKCHNVEDYGRFSGMVYMAYLLGFIDDGERWEWLAKASNMVKD
jgi:hypothetical protein